MIPVGVPLLVVIGTVCAALHQPPQDRIVLLPQANGSPSAVVVTSAQGEAVLDQPYSAAEVGGQGKIKPTQTNSDEVRARYGAVLGAQPPRPVSWVVHFVSGANELTPESRVELDKLKLELPKRPAPEVTVIGHTDRVGAEAANDALSLQRAQLVRDILIAVGVAAQQIDVAGRGEREPLVVTPDEVDEPANRRVEINVR